MEVTIFKDITEITTPFYRNIDVVFDRIKGGNSKELVEGIRVEQNSELRNSLKKKLPSICFSGKFTKRADSSLIEHSGLICLDFDKFPNKKEMDDFCEFVKGDKYTFASFVSPSGNGFKVIVKIPTDTKYHKMYFDALKDYYSSPYFDTTSKNISRVCYESYDPRLFRNNASEIWTDKAEFEQFNVKEKKPVIKIEDSGDKIRGLMVWFNKKYSMSGGARNNNLYILAAAMNEYGVPKFEAVSFCNQFSQEDFSKEEIARTIDSAYSNFVEFGTKYFENSKATDYVSRQIRSGTSRVEIKKYLQVNVGLDDEVADEAINEIEKDTSINEFWKFEKGGVKIINHKFKFWLEQNGFFKLYPEGSDSFVFVRKLNNLVSDTSEAKIKDFVLGELEKREDINVYEFFSERVKYFKEDYLSFLDNIEVSFNDDTEDTAFLYFRNKAVRITKDKYELVDYMQLKGCVWAKHVINRDFVQSENTDNDFASFVYNVSGQDESKEESIRSTLGYLLHSYKNSANNVATILNDEMISDNPNGGTGKGIFINAISKLKRVVKIDGKSFDFSKTFPYQTVSADTHLLVFDDVKKNFNFEFLFSLITEGITLEKKNKDAIKLPVENSPKVLISTNYAIKGEGNSFERRKWDLEFTQYYHKNRTPLNEFGKMLFDGWGHDEWVRFDNYMVRCLMMYLSKGLVKTEFNNLDARRFIAKTSFEFYDWAEDGNISKNIRIRKTDHFNQYLDDNPESRKWLTQRRFAQWISDYAMFKDYRITEGKDQVGRWVTVEDKPSKEDVTF